MSFIPKAYAASVTIPRFPPSAPVQPKPAAQAAAKEQFWIVPGWQEKDAWKNDILIRYQQALITRGIKKDDTKFFVMQLIQENEGLDPLSITGDHGMAYGLGQWNTASARRMRDQEAVRKDNGDFDWDAELARQLRLLAADSAEHYFAYPGDISRAIGFHNGPGRIRSGASDSCRWLKHRDGSKHYSCYFRDEVMAREGQIALVTP